MNFMRNDCVKSLSWIGLAVLGVLIYSNSFQVPLQFDDRGYIAVNPNIQNIFDLPSIWRALSHPSRFVAFYTFALNFHFHQYDVFGYHLVNLIIHIVTSGLVGWLIAIILAAPKMREQKILYQEWIPFLTALLFLVHPLQTQAVTYITQRVASLATLFYVLSICLYGKARMAEVQEKRPLFYFLGAAISAVLGMFTKQIVFTLPIAILMFEFFFFSKFSVSFFLRKQWKAIVIVLSFLLIIPWMFSFDALRILSMTTSSGSHDGDTIHWWNYFLTQFRVIVVYLRLFLIPIGQNLDYDFPLSKSFFELDTFLSFILLAALFFIACRLYKRNILVSFGILWFFLTLSVESSIIPIRHVIFEHRLYLPMVGLSLGLCAGLCAAIKNFKVFLAIWMLVIVIFSYLTFERNKVWRTEVSLWQDVIQKSPNKARPYNNLGIAYLESNQNDLALAAFNNTLARDPKFTESYNKRRSEERRVG